MLYGFLANKQVATAFGGKNASKLIDSSQNWDSKIRGCKAVVLGAFILNINDLDALTAQHVCRKYQFVDSFNSMSMIKESMIEYCF